MMTFKKHDVRRPSFVCVIVFYDLLLSSKSVAAFVYITENLVYVM
jgi:hypothetical protein